MSNIGNNAENYDASAPNLVAMKFQISLNVTKSYMGRNLKRLATYSIDSILGINSIQIPTYYITIIQSNIPQSMK